MSLHKNLTDSQLHNPKGFSGAATNSYPIKNASDELEWVSYGNGTPKAYSEDITGTGAKTQWTITHGLNTRTLSITVIDKGNWQDVQTLNTRNGVNTVQIDFQGYTPTGSDNYTILIQGI